MLDRLARLLLRLYPVDFRARFGPQILADLDQPGTHRLAMLADLLRAGLLERATTPAPYIWLASGLLAAAAVTFSGTLTLRGAYRVLQPGSPSPVQMYVLLFLAVFLVITAVLLLSIHWLYTFRRISTACSKSRI